MSIEDTRLVNLYLADLNEQLLESTKYLQSRLDRSEGILRKILESGTWFASALLFHDHPGEELEKEIKKFLAEREG